MGSNEQYNTMKKMDNIQWNPKTQSSYLQKFNKRWVQNKKFEKHKQTANGFKRNNWRTHSSKKMNNLQRNPKAQIVYLQNFNKPTRD